MVAISQADAAAFHQFDVENAEWGWLMGQAQGVGSGFQGFVGS